jgi:hypothetical protein
MPSTEEMIEALVWEKLGGKSAIVSDAGGAETGIRHRGGVSGSASFNQGIQSAISSILIQ